MNEELKISIKVIADSAKKAIKDVSKELEGLGKTSQGASAKVGAAFKAITKSAAAVVASITAVITSLALIGKRSLETQKELSKLNTAFLAAGSTSKQASAAYLGFYRFLGDSDTAVEAAAHLAKITTNHKNLAEWVKISQGVYASFGKSLPIETLTEAANETIRVGKVVSVMADALNWAGVSEDEFNVKLAQTNSLSEREALVRQTLNGLYSDAAEIYEKNNKALLEHNESQAKFNVAMSQAGAVITPLLTAINNLGSAFFTALKPALEVIIPALSAFVNWITRGIEAVSAFFSALTGKSTAIKAVSNINSGLGGASSNADNLSSGLGGVADAAGNAEKAIDKVRKATMGFDELNIIPSAASIGSGSGSGGGSSSPGYATGGLGMDFRTEVEEGEEAGNRFETIFEKIRTAIEKAKKTFEPAIKAWSDGFDTIKKSIDNAIPSLENGLESFGNGFKNIGSYILNEFVPNIVNSFSTNLAPAITDVIGFAIEELGLDFEFVGGLFERVSEKIIVPALKSIERVATDIFNAIGSAWKKYGAPVLDGIGEAFQSIRTELDNLYTNFIEPVLSNIIDKFDEVWTDGLKPLVENFFESAMSIGDSLLQLYNKTIYPVVSWILDKIYPKVAQVIKNIIDYVGDMLIAISKVIDGVIDVLEGVVQFVSGVFTGDWKMAWEGVKNIFKGIWDAVVGLAQGAWRTIQQIFSPIVDYFSGIWSKISTVFSKLGTNISNAISGAVKSGINGVISSIERTINSAISLINGAIRLVNRIPGVSVGSVSRLSLPRLAKGGVVDSATIAMIGEQGKEAVVPLENNTEWMDKLADKIAARNNTPSKIILKIGEKELGWATINAINGITEQTGGLQLAL